jgi:hypothetical protein
MNSSVPIFPPNRKRELTLSRPDISSDPTFLDKAVTIKSTLNLHRLSQLLSWAVAACSDLASMEELMLFARNSHIHEDRTTTVGEEA